VVHQSIGFGEDLRRRRLEAGLTLTCLARLVHYSKGQLSKVERGIKMPSRDLARLCDVALDAGEHSPPCFVRSLMKQEALSRQTIIARRCGSCGYRRMARAGFSP
jgi:transcriptional regulator with XRE-family HTH domain